MYVRPTTKHAADELAERVRPWWFTIRMTHIIIGSLIPFLGWAGKQIWNISAISADTKYHQVDTTNKIASHDALLKTIGDNQEIVKGDVREIKGKIDVLLELCGHRAQGSAGAPVENPPRFVADDGDEFGN